MFSDSLLVRSFKRSGVRGLAKIHSPTGTLLAYSTSPGKEAQDGGGNDRNGLYTKYLLANIKKPGIPLEQVFKNILKGVKAESNGGQIPWVSSSFTGDFYFVAGDTDNSSLLGKLLVKTNTTDAEIYVNGGYVGKGQVILPLQIGNYNVEARKDGYRRATKKVFIAPNKEIEVSLNLDTKQTWREPITGMEFIWVPGGCYQMGNESSDEAPVHEVCVDGFWIGKYEVTQDQWYHVMHKKVPKEDGENHPMVHITWGEAKLFLKKMNNDGSGTFRMLTEAEWEYACRSGGKEEKYSGGNNLSAYGWYAKTWFSGYRPIGGKKPNGLGIYDMSGNVWEWVEDVYNANAYSQHSRINPIYNKSITFNNSHSHRVIRGGSWQSSASALRCTNRGYGNQNGDDYILGLRIARTK